MTNKVKQDTLVQVPCKIYTAEDRKTMVGTGFIYLTKLGQIIDAVGLDGRFLTPNFYYVDPDNDQERIVVRPKRIQ